MDLSLNKIDLDINSMLINWGLMVGQYEDGFIRKTKFGQLNMAFAFTLFTFEAIKFTILIFYSKESQMTIYFGEFIQYFGPKIVFNFIIVVKSVNSMILISLFYFLSDKMLFWLDHMQFDSKSRCFNKLSLSKFQGEQLSKQFALSWLIIKRINYFLSFITFIIVLVSFFLFKHNYYLSYFISIIGFSILIWYNATQWFGLTLILYHVIN